MLWRPGKRPLKAAYATKALADSLLLTRYEAVAAKKKSAGLRRGHARSSVWAGGPLHHAAELYGPEQTNDPDPGRGQC